jgi:hypothetical protein
VNSSSARALLVGALLLGACKAGVTLTYDTAPEDVAAAARVADARLRALGLGRGRVSIEDGHVVVRVPERSRAEAKAVLEPVGILRFARVEDGGERMKSLVAHVEGDAQARALGISWNAAPLRNHWQDQTGTDVYLTGESQGLQKYLAQLPPELAPARQHRYIIEKPEGRPARTHYVDLRDALVVTRAAEARLSTMVAGLNGLGFAVELRLSPEDGQQMLLLSTALVGKRMAVMLDELALNVPRVETPLPGGKAKLVTDGQLESSERMAAVLAGGALPAPLTLVSESR